MALGEIFGTNLLTIGLILLSESLYFTTLTSCHMTSARAMIAPTTSEARTSAHGLNFETASARGTLPSPCTAAAVHHHAPTAPAGHVPKTEPSPLPLRNVVRTPCRTPRREGGSGRNSRPRASSS